MHWSSRVLYVPLYISIGHVNVCHTILCHVQMLFGCCCILHIAQHKKKERQLSERSICCFLCMEFPTMHPTTYPTNINSSVMFLIDTRFYLKAPASNTISREAEVWVAPKDLLSLLSHHFLPL